jgi:hypothetical protein
MRIAVITFDGFNASGSSSDRNASARWPRSRRT